MMRTLIQAGREATLDEAVAEIAGVVHDLIEAVRKDVSVIVIDSDELFSPHR